MRIGVALCLLPLASTGQVIWDNGSGNNQWGNAVNWNPNSVPTSASSVQFNANDGDSTVNNITLDGNRTANSLTFNNVNDNFSIGNGSASSTLRLTSRTITRTAGSSGNQSLSFTALAPQNDWDAGWNWNIGGTGSLTIASNISGGWGDNVKSGAGTLVLSGNNTFSGITYINQGVVVAASDTALGTSTYGNVIASGAALHLQNSITLQESNFQVAGSGISNTGAIRNLSGNNTLNSSINLTGATTIGSDAGNLTVSSQLSLSHNLTVVGAGNVNFTGDINNSGTLTKNNSGTLTLSGSGANSNSGAITINQGTVALAKTAGTNAIGGATVTVGDNNTGNGTATLRLDASNQIADYAGLITINADGTLQVNNFSESINRLGGTGLVALSTSGYLKVGANSGDSTFGGSLSGSGTLEKIGSGTLTLTSDLSFDGTLLVSAGKLELTGNRDLDATVELKGGTLLLSGTNRDMNIDSLMVTANSIIDFGGTDIRLRLDTLTIAAGVTLTIQNWAEASDYFFTQNWTGASFNVTGSPMDRVVFTGHSSPNTTHWQAYDRQITPVPEPSTYGALLLGGLAAFFALRRRKARQA